jgi:hypothetical protein
MAPGLEQRGHELAPGEVAGAAKKDKIKGHAGLGVKLWEPLSRN